ncbi:hypothetical protein DMN91_003466 [Ooceraea biroi]|uniref:Uncharacterized protein n=1 Tax=Ooceraea biroi TaxID=2015173 RepID=A0A3L8DSW7_OOCBI|nr:hypothetical protein DMN91_003466 [Ooceraea biroi]
MQGNEMADRLAKSATEEDLDNRIKFTSRRQKFGEELSAFGAELERLARFAYPEYSYEIRDKIACAQFINRISGGMVKRTLQIEGQTSLKKAIERARTLEQIHRESVNGGESGEQKWASDASEESGKELSGKERDTSTKEENLKGAGEGRREGNF